MLFLLFLFKYDYKKKQKKTKTNITIWCKQFFFYRSRTWEEWQFREVDNTRRYFLGWYINSIPTHAIWVDFEYWDFYLKAVTWTHDLDRALLPLILPYRCKLVRSFAPLCDSLWHGHVLHPVRHRFCSVQVLSDLKLGRFIDGFPRGHV